MFGAAGLPHTAEMERVPNSRKALRLGELAREAGRYEPLHRRLFEAYWVHGRDIGDDAVLVEEAAAARLPEDDVRDVLATDRYADLVQASTDGALSAGATGVPAWAVDGRVLIPGAQPHEVFERVLAQLGHEPLE